MGELLDQTPLLQVYDMPASVRFYRDVLGFTVFSTAPHRGGDPDRFHWVWLKRGAIGIMLNTAYEVDEERPVPPDAARVTGHNDVSLYITCPDVEAEYSALQAKGVAVQAPGTTPYGARQIYLNDPDGYGLCFQSKA